MATTAMTSAPHRHDPTWWSDQYSRAWDRVKESVARSWAEKPTPIGKPLLTYDAAEPALRYGHGASSYYFDHDAWDASLEAKLRDDWSEIDNEHDWKSVREHVRRGWEHARRSR